MDFSDLEQIGFTSNETRVYLALAQRGRSPAQVVARECKMPRSTAYSVLESLQTKGMVRLEKLRGATVFQAVEPGAILDRLNEDARLIRSRQTIAEVLVKELSLVFQNKPSVAPRLEFVEGRAKVERFLYNNLDRWTEAMVNCDQTSWGFQDHTFVETFGGWIKKAFQVMHIDNGIKGRLLTNRADVERKLKGKVPHREHKVFDGDFDFESNLWVMGDEYVVLIMTRKNPVYAFQLHDPLLAKNLRFLLRFLYENSSKAL